MHLNSTFLPARARESGSLPKSTANGNGKSASSRRKRRTADQRQWNRVTVGFCVGGIAMGIAGCVLGAYMPYQHPVGISISVLWWGIYLGCLGASIGAGIGELF
jgi:hypothetical protein